VIPNSLIRDEALIALVAAAREAPPGDFVEVGVYRGGSAWWLSAVAADAGRRLFLFDTFEGMPFQNATVDHHRPGEFADCSLEAVRAAVPGAIFKVGVFPETLTDDVGPIALAHIDCDQYQSIRDCCERLAPRMVPGGVMIFDDPDALSGAKKALDDCFPGRYVWGPAGKARVTF
jgi:O-methyltransferase